MANPTGKGGFQKGQSGNPGGRPNAAAEIQDKIRERGDDLVEFLFGVVDDEEAPLSQRIIATRTLYEFGYGKAPASLKIEDGNSTAHQLMELIKSLDDKPKPPLP